MKKVSNQIQELEVRRAQLHNRLQALRERQSNIDRVAETRRLVLAGRWLFKICGNDPTRVAKKLADAGLLKSTKDAQLFEPNGCVPKAGLPG